MTTVVFYDTLTWTPQSRMRGRAPDKVRQTATFALYLIYEGGRMILRSQSLVMADLINIAYKEHMGDPLEGWILRIWHDPGTLTMPERIEPNDAKPNLVVRIDFKRNLSF